MQNGKEGMQAGEEEQDEFLDFYNQYRPANNGSIRSSHSTPRSWGSGAISEGGSSIGSGYSSFTTIGGPTFTQGHGVKSRFIPRSRSHGRDPRMTDIMNVYHVSRTEIPTQPEDNLSRDSGNSSGGTPEPGRRGIIRHNSFPQPDMRGSQVVSGPRLPREEQMQMPPEFYWGAEALESYRGYNKARESERGFGDSLSLYGAGEDRLGSTNYDSMSLRSLDSHLKAWSPLAEEFRPKITAKRKFDCFNDSSSLCDEDEVMAKRPRTPSSPLPSSPPSSCWSLLRSTCRLLLLLLSLLTLLLLSLLSLTSYRNYQCTSQRAQSLLPPDLSSLKGQHIAQLQILTAFSSLSQPLPSSLSQPLPSSSPPVLVLLLLGWLGSGKTHTANLISAAFPVQANVHYLHGSLPSYSSSDLPSLILRSCGHSMLLLDDLDPGDTVTIDRMERLILSLSSGEDSRSNGTLVVVTSTAGGQAINQYMLSRAKTEVSGWRERVTMEEVTAVLERERLPLYSSLREYGVPVYLVPFLPLTRDHVRQCVQQELSQAGASMSRKEVTILLDQFQFFSQDFPVFAQTGCKQVASRVGLALGGRADL